MELYLILLTQIKSGAGPSSPVLVRDPTPVICSVLSLPLLFISPSCWDLILRHWSLMLSLPAAPPVDPEAWSPRPAQGLGMHPVD